MLSWKDVAIVIPLAQQEKAWLDLVSDFSSLSLEAEVIFVCPIFQEEAQTLLSSLWAKDRSVKWILAPQGRAQQLNEGARASERPYLWFLHADTRLAPQAFRSLESALQRYPGSLLYFNLSFSRGGPRLMWLTALGVWMRSHLLKIPFGDQGFCIQKEMFQKIGEFRENTAYGEDHLLVWEARKSRIPVICTGGSLQTSARKYQSQGWAKTTFFHLRLTLRQAIPQALQLIDLIVLDK